jgi:hypothetical protein
MMAAFVGGLELVHQSPLARLIDQTSREEGPFREKKVCDVFESRWGTGSFGPDGHLLATSAVERRERGQVGRRRLAQPLKTETLAGLTEQRLHLTDPDLGEEAVAGSQAAGYARSLRTFAAGGRRRLGCGGRALTDAGWRCPRSSGRQSPSFYQLRPQRTTRRDRQIADHLPQRGLPEFCKGYLAAVPGAAPLDQAEQA